MPIGLLRQTNVPFTAAIVAVAGVLTAGGVWLFYAGLRRYASGNMMGLRR
jgi:ABC-2 type transport system permease protein